MQKKVPKKFSGFEIIASELVALSLLIKEYLESSVYVLTKSPKILHITKRDLSQLNCLHIDQ